MSNGECWTVAKRVTSLKTVQERGPIEVEGGGSKITMPNRVGITMMIFVSSYLLYSI